jgi:formylglycine-generating enzyme required for sulfatase activity/tetratricopeptide (TPR) repeat protein
MKEKAIVMALGLLCGLACLEVGLRVLGAAVLFAQAHKNALAMRQRGAYRIMCIGESMTAGQYPPFLERALDGRHIGTGFSVIDRGRIGLNTTVSLKLLEADLDAYHPNMVVAMMGINDSGPHMLYEPEASSKIVRFIKTPRTYKLTRIAWQRIASRGPGAGNAPHGAAVAKAEGASRGVLPSEQVERGWFYLSRHQVAQAREAFKKALETNPGNEQAYMGLGAVHLSLLEPAEAAEAYKKALKINPKNAGAYMQLGEACRVQRKFAQAAEAYKKALETNPGNEQAYMGLGDVYRAWGKLAEAAEADKKTLEINPRNDGVYVRLGWFYLGQGKLAAAEGAFKKASEANPGRQAGSWGLEAVYRRQGKLAEAAEEDKKTLRDDSSNDTAYTRLAWRLGHLSESQKLLEKATLQKLEKSVRGGSTAIDRRYAALATAYAGMGDAGRAKQYHEKAEELRRKEYDSVTAANYRWLKETLDRRGIQLVCVQYPMRSLAPLRKIFQGRDHGIIFVDNENIFKDAVKKDSFDAYFVDVFGGDFGHCTRKGNELLAQSIADVLWREYFIRNGKDAPKFADLSAQRADGWTRYAAQQEAAEGARQKRVEARDSDWAKLSQLLASSVVPGPDKRRWTGQFVAAYMESPGLESGMAKALAPHMPPGETKEALQELANSVPKEEVATRDAAGKADIEWVHIPGGTYTMGDDEWIDSKPRHQVSVKSFQMAKTLVTNKQYKACVADGACTAARDYGNHFNEDDQPVVGVDWNQATAFCEWVGGRLPTEAEWEYAARSGGKEKKYPWGDVEPTCGWAVMSPGGEVCGRNAPWPVCSKPAGNTEQGLCDMASNVWQWVQDWSYSLYDDAPADGSAWENPPDSYRVERGGSWGYDDVRPYRAGSRIILGPGDQYDSLGFRPARSLSR